MSECVPHLQIHAFIVQATNKGGKEIVLYQILRRVVMSVTWNEHGPGAYHSLAKRWPPVANGHFITPYIATNIIYKSNIHKKYVKFNYTKVFPQNLQPGNKKTINKQENQNQLHEFSLMH